MTQEDIQALEAWARAELEGTSAVETIEEVITPVVETLEVKEEKPETKDKLKTLYRTLGKKDKEIEELRSLVENNSKTYDKESLELITSIARKEVLEREIAQSADVERADFLKSTTITADDLVSVEEIRNAYKLPWDAAHRLYKSYDKQDAEPETQKANLSIVGSTRPPVIQETEVDLEKAAREEFRNMFG